jgi:hypothetical protein
MKDTSPDSGVLQFKKPAVQEDNTFSTTGFEHAQRVAVMLSKSDLIPKRFQNRVDNVMIALEMANRMQASPLMVMQNLYVVHGNPGFSGTFIIACLNRKYAHGMRFRYTGTKGLDDWGCIAWTKDSNGEVIEGSEITISMAKAEEWYGKTGSKWKTMPDQMLMYRSAAFFGRIYSPEIMMGMKTYEEIIDISPEVIETQVVDEAARRMEIFIHKAESIEELEKLKPKVKPEQIDIFEQRKSELSLGL